MDVRTAATFALAFSILALALSFGYFTFEVAQTRKDLPQLIASTDTTVGRIESALEDLRLAREALPAMMDEVAATRELIPPILDEVAATRQALPAVLDRLEALAPLLVEESANIRTELPELLATADAASDSAEQVAAAVVEVREVMPEVLAEVEASRAMITPTLDRIDGMLDRAENLGRQASQGVFTGLIEGAVTAPFRLMSDLGSVLGGDRDVTGTREFSEDDYTIAADTLLSMDSEAIGSQADWSNPDTGMSGTLTLLERLEVDGLDCRSVRNEAWRDGRQVTDTTFNLCRESDGRWRARAP